MRVCSVCTTLFEIFIAYARAFLAFFQFALLLLLVFISSIYCCYIVLHFTHQSPPIFSHSAGNCCACHAADLARRVQQVAGALSTQFVVNLTMKLRKYSTWNKLKAHFKRINERSWTRRLSLATVAHCASPLPLSPQSPLSFVAPATLWYRVHKQRDITDHWAFNAFLMSAYYTPHISCWVASCLLLSPPSFHLSYNNKNNTKNENGHTRTNTKGKDKNKIQIRI